jgi:hypothetical protein
VLSEVLRPSAHDRDVAAVAGDWQDEHAEDDGHDDEARQDEPRTIGQGRPSAGWVRQAAAIIVASAGRASVDSRA